MRQTPSHNRISDRDRWDAPPADPPETATVGRHRRSVERAPRPTRGALGRAARSRTALATSALTCLALATLAGQVSRTGTDPTSTTVATVASESVLDDVIDTFVTDREPATEARAGRTNVLDSAVAAAKAKSEPAPAEEVPAETAAAEAVPPPPPAFPVPVAGLDQVQMNNGLRIVQAGQAMGLPKRAYVIAVATSLQESRLRNLASTRIPESYTANAEGEGSDHDSVGLFQQRASTGWGTVSQLMDPMYAATAFYSALVRVPGWEGMELTWAAQRVQVSAFPYAYAKHEPRATEIVNALLIHQGIAP